MIDLLETHLAQLRAQIDDEEMAVFSLAPYLGDGALGDRTVTDAILALPGRIPTFLRALEAVITESTAPGVRGFAGGIFAYVFNPIDIISADELGYLGFVEDAVICWKGLEMVRDRHGVQLPEGLGDEEAERVERVWNSFSQEVRDAVQGFLSQFEQVLKGVF